jgi:RimJ/RimL family protein N-acetyltransferase
MDAGSLRFVPIDRSGSPAGECPDLDEVARKVCADTAAHYGRTGFQRPWNCYLAVADGRVVGTCGFISAPVSGEVEIAYHTFPDCERRGFATAMARGLVSMARAAAPGLTVTAQTLPEPNASNHILRKLGFVLRGTLIHPEEGEVWEWTLADTRGT